MRTQGSQQCSCDQPQAEGLGRRKKVTDTESERGLCKVSNREGHGPYRDRQFGPTGEKEGRKHLELT